MKGYRRLLIGEVIRATDVMGSIRNPPGAYEGKAVRDGLCVWRKTSVFCDSCRKRAGDIQDGLCAGCFDDSVMQEFQERLAESIRAMPVREPAGSHLGWAKDLTPQLREPRLQDQTGDDIAKDATTEEIRRFNQRKE